MVRRVLVVANPYPPVVSAGIMRMQRFLRYLPEYGWRPVVLTIRARGNAPVPPETPVARVRVPLPGLLLRSSRNTARLKNWLFVPDPYVAWVPGAVLRGRQLMREQRYDAIFSSSPHASGHIAAALLARGSGLPWLADYRDPWLNNEFRRPPSAVHAWANATLERWALSRAAAVTAINQAIIDDVLKRAPHLASRTHVVPNGFDLDEPADSVELGDGLWFVHTGRLYGRASQTEAFLKAFARLPEDAHVLFLGADTRAVGSLALRLGIAARVRVEPFAPHRRSLGVQRAADALVLIAGRQRETTTSKVFEYLACGRPVFVLAPPGSAVAELLAQVGGGQCVDPDGSQDDLVEALAAFCARVRAGDLPARDEAAIAGYDVRRLTARLADVLGGLGPTGYHVS